MTDNTTDGNPSTPAARESARAELARREQNDREIEAAEVCIGDRVECPVCGRCVKVQRTGTLAHHGNTLGQGRRGDNYCKGSGRRVTAVLAEGGAP